MSSISITKEFNWAMAHLLEGHKELCSNLHGHNYKLFVTVIKKQGGIAENKDKKSELGMVCDFSNIKTVVNMQIIEKLDHAFMYNMKDKDSVSIAKILEGQIKQKLAPVEFRTTCENILKWIVTGLNNWLEKFNYDFFVSEAKLYETDTSYSTYKVRD